MKSFLLTFCVISHVFFLFLNSSYAGEKSAKGKIHDTEIGFQQRWNDFIKEHPTFPSWEAGWSEQELKERFEK